MSKSALISLLLLVAAVPVHAGPVTFSTGASQVCVGASGCGSAEQVIGGTLRVQYRTLAPSTVNVSGQSFASLGEIVISCVGGGTACGNQSLAGLNVFIIVSQSAPAVGSAAFPGGVIAGSIRGTASNATITWSVPNTIGIGATTYAIANNPLALVPPSANGGVTTIQAQITDPN
jgi:hypothetical protein